MEFELLVKQNSELVEENNRFRNALNIEFADLIEINFEIVEELNRIK